MTAAPEPATRRALLGLGSNLGDRRSYLAEAVRTLDGVVAVSEVYETEPVGGPGGQPQYLNLVVALETGLSPRALLGVCHRLESASGRIREERWGPRTLDVDILWIDGVRCADDDLVVPHPRMSHRRFVLEPLRDVAPDLVSDSDLEQADGAVERLGPLHR